MLCVKTSAVYETEYRLRRYDGEYRVCQVRGAPVLNPDGTVREWFGSSNDVTEIKTKLKRAQDELFEYHQRLEGLVAERTRELERARKAAEIANQAKSDFLAKVSHEIRTPMTAVSGFAELLQTEEVTELEKHTYLQAIQRSSSTLLKLIDGILDLSRAESERDALNVAPFAISEVVNDIRLLATGLATRQALDFDIVVDGSVPAIISTDREKLLQILINLIGNAFKFTSRGGIEFRIKANALTENHSLLSFIVKDTGIGILPEDRQKIFEPFFQSASHSSSVMKSSGLGLAISLQMARKIGANINVESEYGKGSTFVLTLEIPTDDQSVSHISETQIKTDHDSGRPQSFVLHAEDDVNCQLLVRSVLKGAGIVLHTASDGEFAYDMAMKAMSERKPYDLILTDIRMPRLCGLELAKRLRKAGWNSPIVALSAYANKVDQKQCIDAGCNEFLAKPFARGQLLSMVSRYLNFQN